MPQASTQTTRDDSTSWELIVFGAGTAGFHAVKAIAEDPNLAAELRRVSVIDKARIRANNVITCPGYQGHLGRWKAERLAEFMLELLAAEVRVSSIVGSVHELDFAGLLKSACRSARRLVVALVCLDDWEARVAVDRGLRSVAPTSAADVVLCQVSFDLGGAQTVVLPADYASPCLVCGIRDVLPAPESCVVFR
jgi:hypothetical protein